MIDCLAGMLIGPEHIAGCTGTEVGTLCVRTLLRAQTGGITLIGIDTREAILTDLRARWTNAECSVRCLLAETRALT